jgi:hypothetical protein
VASSSSNIFDFVLQNLIAKSALQFPVLATNKTLVTPSKKQWCATTGQETFWTIVDVEIFKANNLFKATDN